MGIKSKICLKIGDSDFLPNFAPIENSFCILSISRVDALSQYSHLNSEQY